MNWTLKNIFVSVTTQTIERCDAKMEKYEVLLAELNRAAAVVNQFMNAAEHIRTQEIQVRKY